MNRREFLKSTAAAGAAAVLPLSILPEEPQIPEKKPWPGPWHDNPPGYRPKIYIPRPPEWLYPHDPKGFYSGFYVLGYGWIACGYGGPFPSSNKIMNIEWKLPEHQGMKRAATANCLLDWWYNREEHDLIFYNTWVSCGYKEETGPRCNTNWFHRVKILPGSFSMTTPDNTFYYPHYKGSFQYREAFATDAIITEIHPPSWCHRACHAWAEETLYIMRNNSYSLDSRLLR